MAWLFLYVQSKKSLDPVKSCFIVLLMQHWLMSEGFPAEFYNWSFNRKKKGKRKSGYKLVSSQDGSFIFFKTFLTSFSKSLRALCSSSNDFFIFLLSCVTETEILLVGLGGFQQIWLHIHCHLQTLKAFPNKTDISCTKAKLLLTSQVTHSYFTQCKKSSQMETELLPICT